MGKLRRIIGLDPAVMGGAEHELPEPIAPVIINPGAADQDEIDCMAEELDAGAKPDGEPDGPTVIAVSVPVRDKADAAIRKVNGQIPFAVADKISSLCCRYCNRRLSFEVIYDNNHRIIFDNPDSFPTDADIARIVLECP